MLKLPQGVGINASACFFTIVIFLPVSFTIDLITISADSSTNHLRSIVLVNNPLWRKFIPGVIDPVAGATRQVTAKIGFYEDFGRGIDHSAALLEQMRKFCVCNPVDERQL
jgi:hypothetical protein